jgi:hypothetical protein
MPAIKTSLGVGGTASTAVGDASTGALQLSWPKHLTHPSPLGWSFWRDFAVRGAGFPADDVLRLADPELATLADRLVSVELDVAQAWIAAESAVTQRIDAILQSHGAVGLGQRPTSALPAEMSDLRRAANFLKRRSLGEAVASVVPAASYNSLRDAVAEREAMTLQFEARFVIAQTAQAKAIREIASADLFRQAVAWQNHSALVAALNPLAAGLDMPMAKRRQREDLVVSYLQRYCVKNDTIGFFGPVAWGRITPRKTDLVASLAHDLIAKRNVYFEDWAVAAVAESVALDGRSAPWLVPRLMPYLRIDGLRLLFPGGDALPLEKSDRELLKACTGKRNSHQIARSLLANPFSCFRDDAQIFEALRRLEQQGRIDLGFPLPTCEARPERVLRAHFDAINDDRLREEALARLTRLETARQVVASAAGQSDSLCEALSLLDAEFESIARTSARRRHGEAYGGRAIVYEDCVRGASIELGESLVLRLQQSLDLVLMSTRWFTSAVAQRYREELERLYRDFCDSSDGASASPGVDLPTFWHRATSLFFGDGKVQIQDIVDDLTRRWASVLPSLRSTRSVSLSVDSIQQASAEVFSKTQGVWAQACNQSPDLMLCAMGADRFNAIDAPIAVLGEIHVGGNTLITNGFVWQHPDPPEFLAARRADLGTRNVVPKVNAEGVRGLRRPIRTQWVDDPMYGTEVLFSRGAHPSNPETAVHIGDLAVVEVCDRLVVRHKSKPWTCDLLALFGDFVFLTIASEFRFLPRGQYVPRITVGGLVWQRETWRISCSELQFFLSNVDSQDFLNVRRLALKLALPSHVFVKVPWENKPFFVDLRSPPSVRLLAKQVRGAIRSGVDPATEISISEMLPSFEDLWLTDAAGQKYTSELRMVAIHRDDVSRQCKHDGK